MGKDWLGYVNILSSVFRAQEEQALKSCGSRTHPYSMLMDLPLGTVLCWDIRRLIFSEIKSSPRVLSMLMKSGENNSAVISWTICIYLLEKLGNK